MRYKNNILKNVLFEIRIDYQMISTFHKDRHVVKQCISFNLEMLFESRINKLDRFVMLKKKQS